MNYNKSYKHLEKIVKKVSNGREVLKGVHHIDNIIEATDSHRALRVYVDKMKFDDHINGLNGEEVEGKYPNLDLLIDREKSHEVKLTFQEIHVLRELSKTFKKFKYDHFVIDLKNKHFTFEGTMEYINKGLNVEQTFDLNELHSNAYTDFKMYFNLDYIIDIFDFLYDYKDDVTLHLPENNVSLINFTVYEKFDYIVLPVRKY